MRLIYFAPVPWDSYAQRPHYVVQYFLHRGGEAVLWINPYATRLPRPSDLLRLTLRAAGPTPRLQSLEINNVRALPVEPLPGGAWLNRHVLWRGLLARLQDFARSRDLAIGIGRPSALAFEGLRRLAPAWSFYDAMDDFPEFYRGLSRLSAVRNERRIVEKVDTLYVSSSHLRDKFSRHGFNPVNVPNACDAALLSLPALARASVATTAAPMNEGQGSPAPGRVVFGYCGTIAAWFDWDTVAALARAFPDARVRLVGPRLSRARGLPANVELHPECPHPDSVQYLAAFSAGLIPFRKTTLTRCVDPIKYYEYRALGLPVLSTSFGEMALRSEKDGVFFVDRGDIRDVVRTALNHSTDARAIEEFRWRNDWVRRFDEARLFQPV